MELWVRIRTLRDWSGWRRHAPAAGSVVAHGVVGLAIVGLMAGVTPPQRVKRDTPENVIELSLEETDMFPALPTTPRPVSPPQGGKPAPDALPVAAGPERKDQSQPQALPDISDPAPSSSDADGVYLGPSPFARPGKPGGLAGLGQGDPCDVKIGPKPKGCGTNWAASLGTMDSPLPRSKEELAQQFGEFIPKCAYAVGCEEREWISTNGTRNVAGTRMAGGAESVGGIMDTVGRLGFNPDHFDRGFGNQ